MEYELAKELEDAGFVQSLSQPQGQNIHDHTVEPSRHYYNPTLEELIEALKGEKLTIANTYKSVYLGWWTASNNKIRVKGLTPIEAAARLWLALHPLTQVKID